MATDTKAIWGRMSAVRKGEFIKLSTAVLLDAKIIAMECDSAIRAAADSLPRCNMRAKKLDEWFVVAHRIDVFSEEPYGVC